MKYLFVGERRSDRAKRLGVTLRDGRLAAKQLFDALKYCDIDPSLHDYCNWFEGGKGKVRNYREGTVVALGNKVARALRKEGIEHIFIFHPAARGKIRKKELYCAHVKEKLCLNLRKTEE